MLLVALFVLHSTMLVPGMAALAELMDAWTWMQQKMQAWSPL
jgi:hypothetical protein